MQKKILPALLLFTATFFAASCNGVTPSASAPASEAAAPATAPHAPFKVFVTVSKAKDHLKMIAAAEPFLQKLAADNNFTIDISNDAKDVTEEKLANYDELIMLQQAPFDVPAEGQKAIEKFVESGHGFVGIHAAGLPGKLYDGGRPHWQWFDDLLGGISYSPHPKFQLATLIIETTDDPITKGLPKEMHISDEWYEFDKSPRLNKDIKVLAHVDESTYHQNKPMGDHPMIWTNTKYHRVVYICIGHSPVLIDNPDYQRLLTNAILWAAEK